jgi:hypothetical protein
MRSAPQMPKRQTNGKRQTKRRGATIPGDIKRNYINTLLSLAEDHVGDAQRYQSLNKELMALSRMMRYGDAIPVAQDVLTLLEGSTGLNSSSVATASDQLAELYLKTDQYDRAAFYFKRALSIFERRFGSKDLTVALMLLKLAEISSYKNDFILANSMSQRAQAILLPLQNTSRDRVSAPIEYTARFTARAAAIRSFYLTAMTGEHVLPPTNWTIIELCTSRPMLWSQVKSKNLQE